MIRICLFAENICINNLRENTQETNLKEYQLGGGNLADGTS